MSGIDMIADLPDTSFRAAITLLHEALILRMYGERPPGAPADNPHAETWPEWDRRAEAFLRAIDPINMPTHGHQAVPNA